MFKTQKEVKLSNRCTSVTFNKTSEDLSISDGKLIKIYNSSELTSSSPDYKQKIVLSNDIINLKYNNDGSLLAASDLDYKISTFDTDNFYNEYAFNKDVLKIWKLDFSPSNNILATGAYNLILFDVKTKEKVSEIYNDNNFIYSLCFIDSQRVAVGNANGLISVFDIEKNRRIARIEGSCFKYLI